MALHKQGLDYYSHPVGMTTGVSMANIRRKYGSVGVDVWQVLLDMIYRNKGYYIGYSDTERSDVLWEISGRVRGKDAPDEQTIGNIIDDLIRDGLFDVDLFMEREILTSAEIQEQFYLSTLKRKSLTIEWAYWLIGYERMYAMATKSPILRAYEELMDDGIMTSALRQFSAK